METTFISEEEKMKLLCLNRTMQYGNSSQKNYSGIVGKSLNRTMQYGNNDILDQYEKNKNV